MGKAPASPYKKLQISGPLRLPSGLPVKSRSRVPERLSGYQDGEASCNPFAMREVLENSLFVQA